MDDQRPQRRHLKRLDEIYIEPAIFLVTICRCDRREILANPAFAKIITDALGNVAAKQQWLVGDYVLMPDHLHFFATIDDDPHTLSNFLGRFKSVTTRGAWDLGIEGQLWQQEFHDHLLRTQESYAKKREYVRLNPVREDLCERPGDWPFSGKIYDL